MVLSVEKPANRRWSRDSCGSAYRRLEQAGHMVTGAIAYDDLQKRSPATIARVVAILRSIRNTNRAGNLNWRV